MTPSFPREFQPAVLRIPHLVARKAYAYGAFTLYGAAFQRTSASPYGHWVGSYNTTSTLPYGRVFGLGSAAFGRPYSRHRICFLFLRVLGCFLSPRSRSLTGAPPKGQDIPFGDPGFNGSLRLPRAFRSLARPSSAPKPSHPPAGIMPEGPVPSMHPGQPLQSHMAENGHRLFLDNFRYRVHLKTKYKQQVKFKNMDSAGFEPAASASQGRRSTAELRALGLLAHGLQRAEN